MNLMKMLIVGNWKMNPVTSKEAKKLFDVIKRRLQNPSSGTKLTAGQGKNVEVVICPPFVYLPLLKGITLGVQNIFWEEKGAFTGEISVSMLKDFGVQYIIVGHSERRKYFNETSEIINKKVKKVLAGNLKPILCVGETLEEKQQGKKSDILQMQITEALKGVLREQFKNIVIVYEPVWAIGNGNNCSLDETMSSVLLIRKIISNMYNRQMADSVKILYGGSVASSNSGEYIKNAGVDGLLVGAASLVVEEFIGIVKSVNL